MHVEQSHNTTATGAAHGALWGTLLGMLFLMPVFGAAVGGATGAVAGKLTDVGVNDGFVKEIASTLEPGRAAVFALVRRSTRTGSARRCARTAPVIHTSLTREREEELVAALHGVEETEKTEKKGEKGEMGRRAAGHEALSERPLVRRPSSHGASPG
ncbi:DUF1269 domain-containing protein [Streptomyces sp. M19]